MFRTATLKKKSPERKADAIENAGRHLPGSGWDSPFQVGAFLYSRYSQSGKLQAQATVCFLGLYNMS